MVSGVNEKELFRYLGLLSDEVLEIHKTLEAIGSREAGVRAALDDLALEKELLIEQTNRLETIVKQTATSAIVDAELEREHQQSIASEKVSLQAQIMDMEESLRAQETQVKELQEQFTAKIEDLHDQIREKDSLLEVRAMAMTDLKNAADSLNRLVSGLSSNGAAPAVRSDEPQDDLKGETPGATMGIEEPKSLESENLRRDVQEKQWELAAKSLKMTMSQQTLGGRIEEPETSHEAKRKKKSLRLVSLLADMGGKRFL